MASSSAHEQPLWLVHWCSPGVQLQLLRVPGRWSFLDFGRLRASFSGATEIAPHVPGTCPLQLYRSGCLRPRGDTASLLHPARRGGLRACCSCASVGAQQRTFRPALGCIFEQAPLPFSFTAPCQGCLRHGGKEGWLVDKCCSFLSATAGVAQP